MVESLHLHLGEDGDFLYTWESLYCSFTNTSKHIAAIWIHLNLYLLKGSWVYNKYIVNRNYWLQSVKFTCEIDFIACKHCIANNESTCKGRFHCLQYHDIIMFFLIIDSTLATPYEILTNTLINIHWKQWNPPLQIVFNSVFPHYTYDPTQPPPPPSGFPDRAASSVLQHSQSCVTAAEISRVCKTARWYQQVQWGIKRK